MAEAAVSYSAEHIEQLLKCPVCLDRLRQPKLLPCQHTFCQSPCLEGLVERFSRIIRCPECRTEHRIPPDGRVASFPNNLTIIGFLDLPAHSLNRENDQSASRSDDVVGAAAAAANTRVCGVCELDADLVRCMHCNKMVCETCKQSHFTQLRLDVGRMVNQIRRGAPKFSSNISGVEQRSQQLKEQVDGVKSEIRHVMERFIKELRDRQKLLESELDTFLQGEQRSLRMQQETYEVELASMASYCDSTENTIGQAESQIAENDLISMKNQCLEYMDAIRQSDNQELPQNKQVRGRFDEQALHSCIIHFGELLVTNPNTETNHHGRPGQMNEMRLTSVPVTDTAAVNTRPLFAEYMDVSGVSISPDLEFTLPEYDYIFSDRPEFSRNHSMDRISQNRHGSPRDQHHTRNSGPNTRGNYRSHETLSRRQRPNDQSFGYMAAMGLFNDSGTTQVTHPLRTPRQNSNDALLANIHQLRNQVDNYANETAVMHHSVSNPNSLMAYGDVSVRERNPGLMGTNVPGQRGQGSVTNRTNYQYRNPGRSMSLNPDERPVIGGGVSTESNSQPSGYQRASFPRPTAFTISVGTNNRRRSNNNSNTGTSGESGNNNDQRTERSTEVDRTENSSSGQSQENQGGSEIQAQSVENGNNSQNSEIGGSASSGQNSQVLVNTNDSSSASSSDNPPAPQLPGTLSRSRTFTREPQDSLQGGVDEGDQVETMEIDEANGVDLAEIDEELEGRTSVGEVRSINNYQQKGVVVKTIGSVRGNSEGCFTWPRGIAVSQDGHIVISDSSNHRVQVFDRNGHFLAMFGSYGQGEGEFDCIAGVAIAPSGNIIISDRYNHRVQILSARGHFIKCFGREGTRNGQLSYPWGLTCDADYIYVCDKDNHRVQIFKMDGSHVRSVGSLGSRDGQFENPQYISLLRNGDILVSDSGNHRLQIFSRTGDHKKTIGVQGGGPGQFKHPLGVAVDQQGFIVVGDSGNNRVQVLKADGRYYYEFGSRGSGSGQFKGLEGVAILANGNVAVCDRDNHRVQIF